MAFYSTAHQKADRGSAILAANGPDRRVGGIGPKITLESKWLKSSHAEIGTVRGHLGRSAIGLLMSCRVESRISAYWVGDGVEIDL